MRGASCYRAPLAHIVSRSRHLNSILVIDTFPFLFQSWLCLLSAVIITYPVSYWKKKTHTKTKRRRNIQKSHNENRKKNTVLCLSLIIVWNRSLLLLLRIDELTRNKGDTHFSKVDGRPAFEISTRAPPSNIFIKRQTSNCLQTLSGREWS